MYLVFELIGKSLKNSENVSRLKVVYISICQYAEVTGHFVRLSFPCEAEWLFSCEIHIKPDRAAEWKAHTFLLLVKFLETKMVKVGNVYIHLSLNFLTIYTNSYEH